MSSRTLFFLIEVWSDNCKWLFWNSLKRTNRNKMKCKTLAGIEAEQRFKEHFQWTFLHGMLGLLHSFPRSSSMESAQRMRHRRWRGRFPTQIRRFVVRPPFWLDESNPVLPKQCLSEWVEASTSQCQSSSNELLLLCMWSQVLGFLFSCQRRFPRTLCRCFR